MNGVGEKTSKDGLRESAKDWGLGVGIVLASAAVLVLFARLFAEKELYDPDPLIASVSWVGLAVGVLSLAFAALIYRQQGRDARRVEKEQKTILAEVQHVLGRVDKRTEGMLERFSAEVPDAEAEEGSGDPDAWLQSVPAPSPSNTVVTTPSGRRRRLFDRDELPLAVIATLVDAWTRKGLDGEWTVGYLRGGFRAEGKGNHPWFLIFQPQDRLPEIWKVSKGKGTTNASKVTTRADLG